MRGHYRASDHEKARLTITVPVEVEQQLRRLATGRGIGISPLVADWIVEKLRHERPTADLIDKCATEADTSARGGPA